MTNFKTLAISATLSIGLTGPALAGFVIEPQTWSGDALVTGGAGSTGAFVGLNWTFGSAPTPELVLGVAHGQTSADGTVQGAKAAVYLDVNAGFALDTVKFTGLYGSTDMQAELGAGYNFQRGDMFGIVGANGSYFAAGVDVYAGMEVEAFFAAHSIGVFEGTGLTCDGVTPPPGFWNGPNLVGDQCEYVSILP